MACRRKRCYSLSSPICGVKENSGKIVSTPRLYFNKCLRKEIREFMLVKHESSRLYFEEPTIRLTPGTDESKYVASGLCASLVIKSEILDRINKNADQQEKQQLWLLEELIILKRKLDDANRKISKTDAEICILLEEKKEYTQGIKQSREYLLLRDELEAFKKKCRAMSLEIDHWRDHIAIEKKRLDDEFENRKRHLQNEYDKKYEELRKASDDFAEKECISQFQAQNSEFFNGLDSEWIRLIIWKEETEQQFDEREKAIQKNLKTMEIMKEGEICIHHCGSDSIKTPAEANSLITNEIDNGTYYYFVLEFPSSGFHLLHEVWLLLSAKYQWKPFSGNYIRKFCNLMYATRDDVAAKVILYVPWCVETQIQCYILSSLSYKDVCRMLLCDLWYGVKQALEQRSDNKLRLKSCCENPSCRLDDERHLATLSTCHTGYFVCDRSKEKYQSTCTNREALEAVMNCHNGAGSSSYLSLEEGNSAASIITNCDEPYLDKEIEFCDLLHELNPDVYAHWQMIAALLNLQSHIRLIQCENSNNAINCFLRVMELWDKNKTKPFTWRSWIKILRHQTICQNDLAEKIIENFKKKNNK